MLSRALKENAGFTIIEVTFTFGILLLTLGMLFGSIVAISNLGNVAAERERATLILADIVEELRAVPFENRLAFDTSAIMPADGRTEVTLSYLPASATAIPLPTHIDELPKPIPNPSAFRITVTRRTVRGHQIPVFTTVLLRR